MDTSTGVIRAVKAIGATMKRSHREIHLEILGSGRGRPRLREGGQRGGGGDGWARGLERVWTGGERWVGRVGGYHKGRAGRDGGR